jgi:hypothetical protein
MRVLIEIQSGPSFQADVRQAIADLRGLLDEPEGPDPRFISKDKKLGAVQVQVLALIEQLPPEQTVTTAEITEALFDDPKHRNRAWSALNGLHGRGLIRKVKRGTWGSVPPTSP